MGAPTVSLFELRRHIPGIDGSGKVVACSCGWRGCEHTDDAWLDFLDHIPLRVPSGRLVLNEKDTALLTAMHIKVEK